MRSVGIFREIVAIKAEAREKNENYTCVKIAEKAGDP